MLRFLAGFACGVYATKHYDFDPIVEFLETKVGEMRKKK